MSEILFEYSEHCRRTDVAAAIDGEVWWNDDDGTFHWLTENGEEIVVPWPSLDGEFDVDEWVYTINEQWMASGARL